jgi:membrane-associated phospholipid phosphatase
MESLTGYAVFHWIATWANPWCDVVFSITTNLGDHTFYCLAVAPLFWVVDRRRAGALLLLILVSGLVNTAAKLWVDSPRPDPAFVRVLDFRPYQAGSHSFPSGHAQTAVVFWGYLAWWLRRWWFSVAAVVLVAAVSFSRLYLGVHFPIDILGGLALGVLLLLTLPSRLERWSHEDFRLPAAAAALLFGASFVLPLASADLSVALICGSTVGFYLGAVWLPQSPPRFATVRHAALAVVGGLVALLAISAIFDVLPHAPVEVTAEVAVLWVLALWVYPQLLQRLWPSLQVSPSVPD